MSRQLPPSASVASTLDGAKMHAPAAARNADVLVDLIARHAPPAGRALELASGTGQHITTFAKRLPSLIWQPSEIDAERIASINAYGTEAALTNLSRATRLDATQAGWGARTGPCDMIVLVNLLHLISADQAKTLISEAVSALTAEGRFILYGPFMRAGQLTSAGDARFHTQLNGANPDIGYKNDIDVLDWMQRAGATDIATEELPANNLAFVAGR